MSNQTVRDFVNRHLGSTTVLAFLGIVLDAKVTATPLRPALQERLEEVPEVRVGVGFQADYRVVSPPV